MNAKVSWVQAVGAGIIVGRLKTIGLIVLGALCLVLAALLYRVIDVNRSMVPYVIRVYPDGRAEGGFYQAKETELPVESMRYFLERFVVDFHSRVRGITETNYPDTLPILSDELRRAEDAAQLQTHEIADWNRNSLTQEAIDVAVTRTELRQVTTQPFEATVAYTKTFKNPMTGLPTTRKPEYYTAQIHFLLQPKRKNSRTNPLGFQVTVLRNERQNDTAPTN
jgi:type IV secretory pathway TrbF-like protein